MKCIWISANFFGYQLLKFALQYSIFRRSLRSIIILDKNARTLVYDIIPEDWWDLLRIKYKLKLHKIRNINNESELIEDLSPDIIFVADGDKL